MQKTDTMKETILVVDDSAMNREFLLDILEDKYKVIEAENGLQALEVLEEKGASISLVLLDIVMPEMDGFEVLVQMNQRGWMESIPVIMISSENAYDVIDKAYDLGVTDFINRPFDPNVVLHRVANTIMLYVKQRKLSDMVAEEIAKREKSNNLMISILSHIVEFRNGESGLHTLHIRIITEKLLRGLQKKSVISMSEEEISCISIASTLHDIGKLSISEEILNKPGKLTDEEFVIMKKHSSIGAEMLKGLKGEYNDPLLDRAYEISRWHHERYDGRGYPDGLAGDQIPISAQIVSIADVYDALTSERCYKKAFSHETAIEMIMAGKCGTFNPVLLECLQDISDELKYGI
ncbi:MAG: response regulator [Lachnospiraceae bacterium]|nr:response regulator [Lachnospiraceae bacterium]